MYKDERMKIGKKKKRETVASKITMEVYYSVILLFSRRKE